MHRRYLAKSLTGNPLFIPVQIGVKLISQTRCQAYANSE
jgi:hypothetical protein